jgi:hypothetical protein
LSIDDLAAEIRATSLDPVVQRLADILLEWKTDNSTVEELRSLIEHFIGNTWISSNDVHSEVYHLWSAFRDEAILKIGGMTMNERLYWFGLLEQFDHAPSPEAKKPLYTKLLARP